jgi:hypothetical protein
MDEIAAQPWSLAPAELQEIRAGLQEPKGEQSVEAGEGVDED